MGKIMQAVHNIADEIHAGRIQNKVQKKIEQGNSKNLIELIEEELKQELSIEPIEEC